MVKGEGGGGPGGGGGRGENAEKGCDQTITPVAAFIFQAQLRIQKLRVMKKSIEQI